jgi:hypothetical protein
MVISKTDIKISRNSAYKKTSLEFEHAKISNNQHVACIKVLFTLGVG